MKPVRILLVVCSVVMACNKENPIRPDLGDGPLVKPPLSAASRSECVETIGSREKARELLVMADGACLERVVEEIRIRWSDDLPAAYLVRAERNDEPVDLLRALNTAKGFNRALALQKLGLKNDAIAAWNAVVSERSQWSDEARKNRDALRRDPMEEFQRLHATPRKLAQSYPFESLREVLDNGLSDTNITRIVADTLTEHGDLYLHDVLDAMARPGNDSAMEAYRKACASEDVPDYERAATLLERAGNPLHLYARFRVAWLAFSSQDVTPLLDALIPITNRRYRMLASWMHVLRAVALEQRSTYPLAYPEYEEAWRLGQHSATQKAVISSRRSLNYTTVGSAGAGLGEAIAALDLLPHVADLNAHTTAYTSAAKATTALGCPEIALLYTNAAVAAAQKAFVDSTGKQRARAQHVLASVLRERADAHTLLDDIPAAEADLSRARDLAETLESPGLRQHLRMRLREVQAEMLLATNPAEAIRVLREALKEAEEQHSTYRAVLHFKLADARRRNHDPRADDDVVIAFDILRNEARHLLDTTKRGDYEERWSRYFSRFQQRRREAIRRSIDQGRIEEAFVQDEQARAFEPLHVLQSRFALPGFRAITSRKTLDQNLAELPEDTIILQFLVLADRTYVWVLRRGKLEFVEWRGDASQIERWQKDALEVLHTGQRHSLQRPMRAIYTELFRTALRGADGKRLVIIPDGPMHGLPFAALESTTDGYVLKRVKSIATDGSTSRYLYALARDRQFRSEARPSVLLAAGTVFDPAIDLAPVPRAQEEVDHLRRDVYPQAEVLSGADVTETRFLAAARGAAIIHFAGHAIPVPRSPWESRLILASGDLTAEKLMRELSQLERTRLVVLGACSTAGGQPVGPEGLAPLVRPLIAANVPAVVGTLWDVNDATATELLVSLHCHYRHGDDVAVALRAAQLERLRKDNPAMSWAPYQVVGYASSPYAGGPAVEKTPDESVCSQNSLQRPDGLHPQ